MKPTITLKLKAFLLSFVIGLFLFSKSSNAQVTIDAVTTATTGASSTNSLTWSHTVAGTNKLLIVTCAANAAGVSGVTYNGTALTKVDNIAGNTENISSEIWYLLNPPTGTANIVWTHSGNEGLVGCGISFNGVNQVTPLGAALKSNGGGAATSSTLAPTTADGDMVVDVISTDDVAVTVGSNQTQRYNAGASGITAGGTSTLLEQCPGTTTSMTWTFASDNFAHVAVPVKANATISPISMTTAAAGTDQTVCGATTATLAGNAVGAGETGTWTLTSGTGTITTPSSATSGITALGASATFLWTISKSTCTSTDDVVITKGTAPTTANAWVDQKQCNNQTATFAGNNPATGTGAWSLVSGGGTITTPTLRTSTVTNLGAGPNTFRWTITNAACTHNATSTDDVVITNTVAYAGVDAFACNQAYTLAGDPIGAGETGLWTVYNGSATITSNTSPTSGLTSLGAGINTLLWTVSNGTCSAVDYVNITEGAYDAFVSAACIFSGSTVNLSIANYNSNSIQWQQNVNSGGWVNIVGATGATTTPCTTAVLTTNTASPAYYQYRAKLTTGGCTDYSAIVTVGDSYCATTCAVCTSCTTTTAGCTTTINANSSAAFTANTGTKLCITGGTYTGTITYTPNNDNGTIVVASGAAFNPANAMSLSNSGMVLEIKSGASATISSISNANTTFTLNNCGSVTVSGNFSTGNGVSNFNNVGTYSSSGDLSFANSGTVCNGGTMTSRDFNISNSGTIKNNGTISVTRDFSLANAGTTFVCPNSNINVAGNMSVSNGSPITGVAACGTVTVIGTSSFANSDISGFNMCDASESGVPRVTSFANGSYSNMGWCSCSHTTLPINLIDFIAYCAGGNTGAVNVNWSTASEVNNNYFTVERTVDGVSYKEIGRIAGAGNSNSVLQYSMVDENPLKEVAYYRLKQTDYDGAYAYSNIVSVECGNEDPLKILYFFPDRERNTLQYQFHYTGNKSISVEVMDVLGQRVLADQVEFSPSQMSTDASALSGGVYILKVSDGKNTAVKKFIY